MKAKKSLGQNFLRSTSALAKIVSGGNVGRTDVVLEIGPGKGALTTKLLEVAQKVVAIEKDQDLIGFLQEKFQEELLSGKLEIIEGDVLDFDESHMKKYGDSYKLIANIPYYITGEILEKFLSSEHQPTTIVFLLQKEVVDRIVAKDNKESILSMSVNIYGTPHYIQKVPAKAFNPAPKVDSAILAITDISKEKLKGITEKAFFACVKQGFAHKRKKLVNNLEKTIPKARFYEICIASGIDPETRAENLTVEQWITLAKEY